MSHIPPNRPWDLPPICPTSAGRTAGQTVGGFSALAGVVALVAIVAGPPAHGDAAEGQATRNCTGVVLRQLMTPGTASFDTLNESSLPRSGGGWVITGELASRNSYGGRWSSGYRCDTKANGAVTRLTVT